MKKEDTLKRRDKIMDYFVANPDMQLERIAEHFKIPTTTAGKIISAAMKGKEQTQIAITHRKKRILNLIQASLNGLSPYRKRKFLLEIQEAMEQLETFL